MRRGRARVVVVLFTAGHRPDGHRLQCKPTEGGSALLSTSRRAVPHLRLQSRPAAGFGWVVSVERGALPPAGNRGRESERLDLGFDGSLSIGLAVDQKHALRSAAGNARLDAGDQELTPEDRQTRPRCTTRASC